MPFAPPNTFLANTKLLASEVQGNTDALRAYLHDGIVASDLEASQWVDTRHVQPPLYEPYSGVQHGVSGHQGGYWSGGDGVSLSFLTSFLTGNGLVDNSSEWTEVPNTAFKIELRRTANVLFHWSVEVEAGPDDATAVTGRNYPLVDRLAYVAPYIGNLSLVSTVRAQEIQNHQEGWGAAYPVGAAKTFPMSGAYGQRSGVYVAQGILGALTVGLAAYSQIDRSAVVNWNVAIEAFYI